MKSCKERVACSAQSVAHDRLAIALHALRSTNWLGLLLSTGALYFTLHRVQWNDAWAA